jgi:hypothetical protein
MKFKVWFEASGISVIGLARVSKLSRTTIQSLLMGKTPRLETVRKLEFTTKSMKVPVKREMWEKIKGYRKKKA